MSPVGPVQANFSIKKPSPLRLPTSLAHTVAPTTVMASLGRCFSVGRKVITSGLLRSYRLNPDCTRLTLQPYRLAAPATIRCYTSAKRVMGEIRVVFPTTISLDTPKHNSTSLENIGLSMSLGSGTGSHTIYHLQICMTIC